jgi:hypothetical protein
VIAVLFGVFCDVQYAEMVARIGLLQHVDDEKDVRGTLLGHFSSYMSRTRLSDNKGTYVCSGHKSKHSPNRRDRKNVNQAFSGSGMVGGGLGFGVGRLVQPRSQWFPLNLRGNIPKSIARPSQLDHATADDNQFQS